MTNFNMSNFKMTDDRSFNCYDSVVSSLLIWYNKNYELMFLNNWGFSYKVPYNSVNDSINANHGDISNPLKIYQGINFEKFSGNPKQAFDFIVKELEHNRPLILNTNIYWCPWNSRYKKIWDPHSVIVFDVDKENNLLKCIDKTILIKDKAFEVLNFEDFCAGYKSLTKIAFKSPVENVNWKAVITESILSMMGKGNYNFIYFIKKNIPLGKQKFIMRYLSRINKTTNAFNEMKTFAHELKQKWNLDSEKKENLPIHELPMMKQIGDIANGRRKFAMSLECLINDYNADELSSYSMKMNEIGWMWEEIKFLLFETLNDRNTSENLKKCSSKILEIADVEQKTAQNLLDIATIA